jgi:thiamine biosynthesis lipoprotein
MSRSRLGRAGLAVACLSAVVAVWADSAAAMPVRTRMRLQMGSLTEITVPEPDYAPEAVSRAFDAIERLDRLLSTFRSDSEVMRLARELRLRVSPETLDLTRRSRELSLRTEGAFNPLVAPLVALWKQAGQDHRLPAAEAVERTRRLADWSAVQIDPASAEIAFAQPGMALDFGAIGKGYAVDRAAESLRQDGLSIALVASGGSSHRMLGHPPRGCWEIGIRHPEDPDRTVAWLRLGASGVATSSDRGQGVEIEGRRYGHILDPSTGYPAAPPDPVWSATVIGAEATTPDAVATAAVVAGASRGLALVESLPGLHALLVLREGEGIPGFRSSPGLEQTDVLGGLPVFMIAADPHCAIGVAEGASGARFRRPESLPLP